MVFSDDVSKAIVFDCRREDVETQLYYLRLTRGVMLKAEPVDPSEIHETCDRCGHLALSFHMFFDGQHYLCPDCRESQPAPGREP